jgi:hypothetical protein
MGVESLSPKLTRRFKPKRKLAFKPKAAGLGTEAKGIKLSVWKPLENALGPSRRDSTSSCRAVTSTCVAGKASQPAPGLHSEESSTEEKMVTRVPHDQFRRGRR